MKKQYDDIDEYIGDLKKEIETNEKCATHHYNLGVALLHKRDFMAAEEAFLNAVRQSPRLAEAYIQLGAICMNRGDMEGCLRYNQEASQCRPKYAIPQANIGFVHLQNGEPDKALQHFTKALKWNPGFVQARNGVAVAHYMQQDFKGSENDCRALLADEPEFGPAWHNLANALLAQDRKEEAREACQKAIELGCDIPEGLLKDLDMKK